MPLKKLLIITAMLLSLSASYADEVMVGFGKNRAPYVMGNADKGISVDLFRAALAHKGHVMNPVYIAADDALAALHHRVDAISYSPNLPSKNLFLSDVFVVFKDCIITKTASGIALHSIDDLVGRRITAWPGAHKYSGAAFAALFSPEHASKHSPEYFEHENQLAQNQMFWRGHTDIIILDENIFRWYRHALKQKMDTSESVDIHYLLPQKSRVRATFKQAHIRDDFNAGIQALRDSGEYQRIVQSYVDRTARQLEHIIAPRASASPSASTSPAALKKLPTTKVAFDKSAKMPKE